MSDYELEQEKLEAIVSKAKGSNILSVLEHLLGDESSAIEFLTSYELIQVQFADDSGEVQSFEIKIIYYLLSALIPEEFLANWFGQRVYLISVIKLVRDYRKDVLAAIQLDIAAMEKDLSDREWALFDHFKKDLGETDTKTKARVKFNLSDDREEVAQKKIFHDQKKAELTNLIEFIKEIVNTFDLYVQSFTSVESLMTVSETWLPMEEVIRTLIRSYRSNNFSASNEVNLKSTNQINILTKEIPVGFSNVEEGE